MNGFTCVKDFELHATQILPATAVGYFNSGASKEQTLQENTQAFKRWCLRPKILRGVSSVRLDVKILGNDLSFPICIAPTSLSKLASPNGEIDAASAALELGTLYAASSLSTSSIEEIASVGGNLWFQLYVFKDRELTRSLVERAEKNGFSALVLTVDVAALGKRLPDIRNKFTLPSHISLRNFDGRKSYQIKGTKESGLSEFTKSVYDSSLTWHDVDWLRSITNLPIILKGIMTCGMAEEATKHNVSGIIVSNHGGRQLDGTPASIDVLPLIVKSVGQKCDVYLDGGIRTGTDVSKAIALGAKAVFIGRPAIWGLCCGGRQGVVQVLEILRDELEMTMRYLGVRSIAELQNDPTLVMRVSSYLSKL